MLARRILLISDTIDRAEIVRMLHEPILKPREEALHLIIDKVTDPSEMNLFLFELLVLRVIFAGVEVVFLPSDLHVFIELETVTDTAGVRHVMLDELPFVAHFPRRHLVFNIETLDVPNGDGTNVIQIVAQYLNALRENTIDRYEVNLEAAPIHPDICRRLLHDYFLEGGVTSPSMRLLDTFVRILAGQLEHLSKSPFLSVSGLNLTGISTSNTRTILVKALINVSRDFALRSLATNSDETDYVKYMSSMKKWSDSNHLLVSAAILFYVNV